MNHTPNARPAVQSATTVPLLLPQPAAADIIEKLNLTAEQVNKIVWLLSRN